MNRKISLSQLFPLIREQLDSGGTAQFTIHGTSMLPLLKDGVDRVRLAKPDRPIRKYDIIFYCRDDGTFVLHRVIRVKKEGFVCRGDNQTEKEFPVFEYQVIAVVTHYTQNGEWQKADGFFQRLRAKIWVYSLIFRRIKRKFFKGKCK